MLALSSFQPAGTVKVMSTQLRLLSTLTSTLPPLPGSVTVPVAPVTVNASVNAWLTTPGPADVARVAKVPASNATRTVPRGRSVVVVSDGSTR